MGARLAFASDLKNFIFSLTEGKRNDVVANRIMQRHKAAFLELEK